MSLQSIAQFFLFLTVAERSAFTRLERSANVARMVRVLHIAAEPDEHKVYRCSRTVVTPRAVVTGFISLI